MTPTSPVGNRRGNARQRGITLLEMLIVVALMALLAGLSYSPVSAGLETLRLRSASDQVVGFLATALDRADRKQAVVELQILPVESAFLARTADQTFVKRLNMPLNVHIVSIRPMVLNSDPNAVRRFLLYPGGSVPQIAVEIANSNGRKRMVSLDPFTGTARAVEVTQ
jgi:prepilin-type N-terminal cleavage/methylation domain-containing protein